MYIFNMIEIEFFLYKLGLYSESLNIYFLLFFILESKAS